MTRRTRRPAPQQGKKLTAPAPTIEPVPGPDAPEPEPVIEPDAVLNPIDAELAALEGEPVVVAADGGAVTTLTVEPAAVVADAETPAPTIEPVATPSRSRFGGKGDHDHDGVDGGVAEVVVRPRLSAEPSLNDLNRQAWAIDDEHNAKRLAAEEAINAVAAPLLAGVPRGRQRVRRVQKPLRGLVKG